MDKKTLETLLDFSELSVIVVGITNGQKVALTKKIMIGNYTILEDSLNNKAEG